MPKPGSSYYIKDQLVGSTSEQVNFNSESVIFILKTIQLVHVVAVYKNVSITCEGIKSCFVSCDKLPVF